MNNNKRNKEYDLQKKKLLNRKKTNVNHQFI